MRDIIRDLDFFTGIRCGISPCCIDFYELCYLPSIKNQIPEYSKTMWELSNETGILLCPDCISKHLDRNNTLNLLNPITDYINEHFTT